MSEEVKGVEESLDKTIESLCEYVQKLTRIPTNSHEIRDVTSAICSLIEAKAHLCEKSGTTN